MTENNIPWESIGAFLKNRSDSFHAETVKKWLHESPDNALLFDEILNTWALTCGEASFYQPDEDKLWQSLTRRTNLPVKSTFSKRKLFIQLAAAATLALFFLAGNWWANYRLENSTGAQLTRVVAPPGSKTQGLLPDQTLVWLNSGATLEYPSRFSDKSRDVYISGECYFDVKHDEKKPFQVHCSDLQIRVLGTKFNIREKNREGLAEVTLLEGAVVVKDRSNSPIARLKPGEQLVYGGNTNLVRSASNPDALTSWTNNVLSFSDQPFEEVIYYLENWYGVTIHLDSSLYNNHSYTFRVKTESLREVLELISVITPINYEIAGEHVTIKYRTMK